MQNRVRRDDFNRPDSTNMSANQTEHNGDFSITGNRAVEINHSAAKFNGNTPSGSDFDRFFFIRDSGFIYKQACQDGIGISSPFTSARDGASGRDDAQSRY